ncbi:TPA: hypothetical protein ACH3X1_010348 [Trebouxia sp. C0004]
MQGGLTSSIFELRASNTKLQTQLNVLQLQLAETKAQLQHEQTQREVTEDRSLEQAKRAAAVNVEVVKANNLLKQQLRVSKSQVKAEEDRLLMARLQAQLNDFQASQQGDSIPTKGPAAMRLSAWQANEYITAKQHDSMSQGIVTSIADRAQPEAVSASTSAPRPNSRAAQKAEHTQACHQLHSDGHVIASQSEATGESADVSTTNSALELGCDPAASSCPDMSCMPADSTSAYTAVQTWHKTHVDLDLSAHSDSATWPSTTSGSSRHCSKQKGVLPTDRAGDALTGSGSRCTTAMQPSETEHSRGLQQLWNSMARTPLAVPSPRAVASSLSQASVASSAADLPDQQSGCAAEPFSLPRTGRGMGPSVSSSTSTGAAARTDTAASEQHQVPSENDADGTDAETPVRSEQRRSVRTKPRVVYEEPKLRTKLRQGDAFTFGIAEIVPRSAMKRKSVMPKQKGNLESPEKM